MTEPTEPLYRRAPYVEPSLVRRATGRWRSLPSVIIVGAHAAGTTSLYTYLGQHSMIHRAKRRELHYFSMRPDRPLDWYRSFFPLKPALALGERVHGHRPMTMECSPTYMYRIPAMQQLVRVLPEAKIIAVLRHPIDRARSGYSKAARDGWEDRPFEQSMDRAIEVLEDEWQRLCNDPDYGNPLGDSPYHMLLSLYGRQIAGWLKHFDPAQVLVVQSEAMFADPQGVYDHVLNWLDMPLAKLKDARAFNVTGRQDKVEPQTRRRLTEFLAEDVALLEQALGAGFDWFSESAGAQKDIEVIQPEGKPVTIRRQWA